MQTSPNRIQLGPLTLADRDTLFQWINDAALVRKNSAYAPVAEDRHRAWFDTVQTQPDVHIFAIRLSESGKLIGCGQIRDIDTVHRTAELRIRIGESAYRGKGYGPEALRHLLDFAFYDLNLNRIYLEVLATNTRAVRAYEKCGFVREGTLRSAAYIEGRYVDVVLMGILRQEHAATTT